jgi:hypothetical protein
VAKALLQPNTLVTLLAAVQDLRHVLVGSCAPLQSVTYIPTLKIDQPFSYPRTAIVFSSLYVLELY